jgi:hypothetical protein
LAGGLEGADEPLEMSHDAGCKMQDRKESDPGYPVPGTPAPFPHLKSYRSYVVETELDPSNLWGQVLE